MSDVTHVDDNNFETEVLAASGLVIVEFGATWCAPCQKQLPILEKFAAINQDIVKVCAVDIDDAQRVAAKLNIRSIPTILVFESGKQTGMRVGLCNMQELSSILVQPVKVAL